MRKLELADMFILDLENEDPTACKTMIIIMEQGKTLPDCSKGAWSLQSRICIVQFVLLVLLHSISSPAGILIQNTNHSLSTSQEWFNLKFAPGRRGPAKEITYNSHVEAMKKCLGSLQMNSATKHI